MYKDMPVQQETTDSQPVVQRATSARDQIDYVTTLVAMQFGEISVRIQHGSLKAARRSVEALLNGIADL